MSGNPQIVSGNINFNTILSVDYTNDNVGVGTTLPSTKYEVRGPVLNGYQNSAVSLGDSTGLLYLGANSNIGAIYSDSGAVLLGFNQSSGDVGIGITEPAYKLDVDGSTLSQRYLFGNSTTYQRIDYNTSGYGLWATTSGSGALYVNDSGNVGIGTTNPTEKLHVKGNLYVQGNFVVFGNTTYIDTNVTVTDQFYISNDGTGPALIVNQNGAEAIADFRDDSTSIMYLANGGNVGIGSTNPVQKLDVSGNTNIGGQLYIQQRLWAYQNYDQFLIGLGGSGTESQRYAIGILGDYTTGLVSNVRLATNGEERLYINSSGYVGIGTTNPATTLEVHNGSLRVSNSDSTKYVNIQVISSNFALFQDPGGFNWLEYNNSTRDLTLGGLGSQSADRLWIMANGNVGMGVSTPGAKLDVYRNYGGQPFGTAASTIGGTDSGIGWSGVKIMERGGSLTSSDAFIINALANNTSQFVVTGAGAVGIGLTNPESYIHARAAFSSGNDCGLYLQAGDDSSTKYGSYIKTFGSSGYGQTAIGKLTASGGAAFTQTEYIRINDSGSVGIGITTPEYRLSFSNDLETKVALFNSGSGNIYGFGVSGSQLNYHVLVNDSHVFYAGGSNGDGTELMRIQWNPTLTVKNPAGPTGDYSAIADFLTPNIGIGKNTKVSIGKANSTYNCGEIFFNYQGDASQYNFIGFGLNGVSALHLDGYGNVGIGITNPSTKLDVGGQIKAGQITAGAGGPGSGGYSFGTGGDTDGGMFSTADGTLQFYTNNTEGMRIDFWGKVGIGTTNPQNKLELYSTSANSANLVINNTQTISYDGILYKRSGIEKWFSGIDGANSNADWTVRRNSTTNDITILSANGNVGIGTTNPSEILQVQGNLATTGNFQYSTVYKVVPALIPQSVNTTATVSFTNTTTASTTVLFNNVGGYDLYNTPGTGAGKKNFRTYFKYSSSYSSYITAIRFIYTNVSGTDIAVYWWSGTQTNYDQLLGPTLIGGNSAYEVDLVSSPSGGSYAWINFSTDVNSSTNSQSALFNFNSNIDFGSPFTRQGAGTLYSSTRVGGIRLELVSSVNLTVDYTFEVTIEAY